MSLVSSPSWGADLHKALAAANSGDFETALRELAPLAEKGDFEAQYNLAVLYYEGDGVLQDYKTALKWYTLAAEQGHSSAQHNLGVAYYNGDGVLQDHVYAHMWWNIAASNGHKSAGKNRQIVVKNMTLSQIEKAQDLARECVAKNYKGC